MEVFTKIAHGFQELVIFAKKFLLDHWQGSEYASVQIMLTLHKTNMNTFCCKVPVSFHIHSETWENTAELTLYVNCS